MIWNILILSLCLMLLAFLLWKEIGRKNRLSLIARIIASVSAVAALALIALPVTVNRIHKNADSSSAIILTDGFHKDSIQSFARQNPGVKLFSVDKSITSADFVADLSLLWESPFSISTLHIFGNGLYGHDLERVKKMNLVFHPTPVTNRITSVDWQQTITSGQKLVVQGRFNNASERRVKIILNGFNTNLDSAELSPGQHSTFELATLPKHIDKAVYFLTVLSAGDTIESNPIPINVEIPKPINILLLAESPDFENKFLKNWLADKEYGFAARTYISKNKYERQYVNISSISLGRLTPTLLDKFDVVIADLTELHALPSSDLSNLRSSIEGKGLGLIVKATATRQSAGFYLSSFPLIETRDSIQHTVKLNGGNTPFPSPLKIQQPVYILNRAGTEPLLTDQHARTLASSKMLGLGKVIITTIPNSYAWWLSGNKEDFASYWTILLNKAAKKIVSDHAWEQSPGFPRKDFEMNLRLHNEGERIPELQVSSEALYPHQHPFLPYAWSGRYWPAKAGWRAIISDAEPASWIYIYGDADWPGIAAATKSIATKKYAGNNGNNHISKKNESVPVEIPKIYFMILFMISTAFLWIEKKYRNG